MPYKGKTNKVTGASKKAKREQQGSKKAKREQQGIRCAKWVLRPTPTRLRRGRNLSPPTPVRIAPVRGRDRRLSSPASSQNSCNGPQKDTMAGNDLQKWPADHTELFIRILMEVKNTTSTRNNISRRSVAIKPLKWMTFAAKMQAETGSTLYDEKRLKTKWRNMRQDFCLFQSLLNRSCFGYDEDLGTVTADEEKWQEVIQINKDYARFRYKGLPHYMLLKGLFDNTFPIGDLARSSEQGAPDTDEEDTMNQARNMSQSGSQMSSGSRSKRKAQEDVRNERAAKKDGFIDGMTEFIKARTCQLQAEWGVEGSSAMPMPYPAPPPPSITYDVPTAMAVLNDIVRENGLTQDFWFQAGSLITTSVENRQAFLSSPPEWRYWWLVRMLGGGGQ